MAGFIQGRGAASVGTVASKAMSFTSDVTAGNTIVVGMVTNGDTITTTSVTDSLGNTYTRQLFANGVAGGRAESALFYAKNITGGACTVTCDPTGSDFVSMGIAELDGDETAPFDGAGGTWNASGTTYLTGSWTSSAVGVQIGIMEQNQAQCTIAPAGGYTEIAEDETATNQMPFSWIYLEDVSPGSGKTASWTLGASNGGTACAGSFKNSTTPAGGGTATVWPYVA